MHYLVDADGSRVAQFIPETDTGWHAGNYFYNETSIGIEHVGRAADPAGYAAALYATSEALVRDIATRWPIPLDRDHIIGHYQVPDGNVLAEDAAPCAAALASCETDTSYGGADNHRDPGMYWDWTGFLAGITPPQAVFDPATTATPPATGRRRVRGGRDDAVVARARARVRAVAAAALAARRRAAGVTRAIVCPAVALSRHEVPGGLRARGVRCARAARVAIAAVAVATTGGPRRQAALLPPPSPVHVLKEARARRRARGQQRRARPPRRRARRLRRRRRRARAAHRRRRSPARARRGGARRRAGAGDRARRRPARGELARPRRGRRARRRRARRAGARGAWRPNRSASRARARRPHARRHQRLGPRDHDAGRRRVLAVRATWPVAAEPRAVLVSDDGCSAAFVSRRDGREHRARRPRDRGAAGRSRSPGSRRSSAATRSQLLVAAPGRAGLRARALDDAGPAASTRPTCWSTRATPTAAATATARSLLDRRSCSTSR